MQTPRSFLKIVLLSTDFLVVNLSCLLPALFLEPDDHTTIISGILLNIIWLFFAIVFHAYSKRKMIIEEILRNTLKIYLAQIPIFIMALYAMKLPFTDKYIGFVFVTLALLLFASRMCITYLIEYVINKKISGKKFAILGISSTGNKLAEYIKKESNHSFVGFIDHHVKNVKVEANGEIIQEHNIDECIDFAIENNVNELYSTILPEEQPSVINLVKAADQHCIRVRFVADLGTEIDYPHKADNYEGFKIISLRIEPLQSFENRIRKRLFDIVVSSFVIVCILSWLYPIIALLIKLDSRGPILFKQLRTGRDNKPFMCFKFRSMKVNDESDLKQAERGDSRITELGRLLRKSSLDEFPQFFNVFMGDMSIVGPRPHMLKHTEEYSRIIGKYMVRQFLKPGITGWAQVNGYRGETKNVRQMEERVEHDIWYMENWSLMLDVKIMFMTIINVIKGETNAH